MMIKGTKVRLRDKSLKDAPDDYRWQTDPELSDLDAVSPLNMSYEDFLEEYKDTLRHSSGYRRSFAIYTPEDRHIGNCVYYNIDRENRQAEIGIMIGERDYWDLGYGSDAVTALCDFVFRHANFVRLYLKTLEKNIRAQHAFRKCGFTPYGNMERDGYRFILMELPRERWEEMRASAKR
jgi:RimJ/RimL family protein N-acetyltransferase